MKVSVRHIWCCTNGLDQQSPTIFQLWTGWGVWDPCAGGRGTSTLVDRHVVLAEGCVALTGGCVMLAERCVALAGGHAALAHPPATATQPPVSATCPLCVRGGGGVPCPNSRKPTDWHRAAHQGLGTLGLDNMKQSALCPFLLTVYFI